MTLRLRPLLRSAATALTVGAIAVTASSSGCIGQADRAPPVDRAVFPAGLAISPDGTRLAVVSSNFDFTFDYGAVLLADLPALESRLVGADVVVEDPYIAAAFVPTFGDRPVFSSDGGHLLLTSRDTNLVHELVVDSAGLSCGVAEVGAEVCDQSPHALGLAQNDPFDVAIVEEGPDAIRAFVTHQSGREGSFVLVTPSRTGADRLRLEAGTVDFGETAFGVRGVVVRPATDTRPARLFATVERRTNTVAIGAELVSFDLPRPGRAGDVVPVRLDLEPVTGSRSARDVVIVNDGEGGVALIVALRIPDALARFRVDARGVPTLTSLTDTCQTPISLAVARIPVSVPTADSVVERVLVTCQEGQAVQALDPLTLQVTDAVRFFGRGPYDVVVTPDGTRAFVSFFLDNSIGAFSLGDGTVARLTPIGRLGKPLPRPEDGRE